MRKGRREREEGEGGGKRYRISLGFHIGGGRGGGGGGGGVHSAPLNIYCHPTLNQRMTVYVQFKEGRNCNVLLGYSLKTYLKNLMCLSLDSLLLTSLLLHFHLCP